MFQFISALFFNLPFINWPDLFGWLFGLALLGFAFWLYLQSDKKNQLSEKKDWLLFGGLFLLTWITNLFLGVYLKSGSFMSWPGVPLESPGAALMLFSALPWIVAAGVLGPAPAFFLGFLAGAVRAPFDSHTIFTSLQYGVLALLFNNWVRQRYRTRLYTLLRQPLFTAIALLPVFALLFIPSIFFSASHPEVTARLDFAINNLGMTSLALFGELLIAGIIAQILAVSFPEAWGRNLPLKPSPSETRIETRFLIGTGTFIVAILLVLLVGDWVVAGQAAQRMLNDRLENTAQVSAESIPFFLETGQNLSKELSEDSDLLTDDPAELTRLLSEKIGLVPYFTHLLVLDLDGNIIGEYPQTNAQERALTQAENSGLFLAINGVPSQVYSIPPAQIGESARVSFMVTIANAEALPERIFIGRTSLNTNPITRPLLNSLDSMKSIYGHGMLIDENGTILYHSESDLIMTQYTGAISSEANFFDATSSTGTRNLVYFQPVVGQPWSVVLSVPARQIQQLALEIALPLSGMILFLTAIALITLRIGLRIISQSLENLANEAGRIAQGKLDHPLDVDGMDEVGQLRRAFEQMRVSLKDRLDELNTLLVVSNSVASSLEMRTIFQPVLEAIRSTGANAVHVVLAPEIAPDTMVDMPTRFALEPNKGEYAHLDVELLEMVRYQDKIVLPNLTRTSGGLQLNENRPNPQALIALPLRNEQRFYGVLWAAYPKPKIFTESDVRFISTLGGQAALAAANAHLFMSVEVGRQQLASILDSTTDPVLVTDHQDNLLLANPAAWQLLSINPDSSSTRSIEDVIEDPALIDLLRISTSAKESAEIIMPSGEVFLATASSVIADEVPIGRVCILRDVTHFKELDKMKSEFVATVSHDLRSPLTLMRGYATMMPMIGELNDQQKGYADKIISGVENMTRLVNNLLDLGRIELGVGLQLEKISPLEIVDQVSSGLQGHAKAKNIDFTIETSKKLPGLIDADQALLHQAVYNLVENAIKYTPENGSVTLRVHASNSELFFDIEDSGIGISEEALKRLFEKFFRSSQREARAQQGTGLGLAIVRSIAERHGGEVWVDSIEGKGSTFHLRIPILQS
jgi:signal transduction histidine kinase